MVTSCRSAFLIALALGLAPACSAGDGDVEDGDGAVETADDVPDSACDCAVARLRPDSEAFVGLQNLACFCRENYCLSYEQSSASNCSMPAGSRTPLRTYAGCNLVEVASPPTAGISFTYDATTQELVGAYAFSDLPAYDCAGEAVHGLKAGVTAFSDFPDCQLTERTPLCE